MNFLLYSGTLTSDALPTLSWVKLRILNPTSDGNMQKVTSVVVTRLKATDNNQNSQSKVDVTCNSIAVVVVN